MNSKLIALTAMSLMFFGCNAGKNQTNIELVTQMMDQESLKAQDYDYQQKQTGSRVPPEGTVPRNHQPYKYSGDVTAAEAQLKNPHAGDFSPEFLTLGRKYYQINCAVCHGDKGGGDGSIAPFFSIPIPSLVTDKAKDFSDGRIFHIIVEGQGLMGSYASQVQTDESRWAVVNYVRSLQRGN